MAANIYIYKLMYKLLTVINAINVSYTCLIVNE